jgi:hypothetical protein
MKKLLVAAIMVVLATPAFAAIQNVKVSGDITTSWLNDDNLDLGAQSGGNPIGQNKQNVFLTQTRLRVDADLSDNVSTTVGLINERAWNAENSAASDSGFGGGSYADNLDTNVQLYLASITLREFLYSPLTLQIGRQVFNFGNGLILGDGGPVNSTTGNLANIYADLTERTAYDGVTATLDYKPLTISLIYFKNGEKDEAIMGHFSKYTIGGEDNQSSDVYGYNASYQLGDAMNTVVEQYLFARINGVGFDEIGGSSYGYNTAKGSTMYVPGLRASTNPIKGLNVQGEIAWELGSIPVVAGDTLENEHRDAMAAQVLASYALPVMDKYKPTVNASWTYVSGDKNSALNYGADAVKSAKTYSAWDEFNTIQGAGTIYRAIFPLSNENIISFGASVNPLEDVTAGVTWSGLWALEPYGLQNPGYLIQPDGSYITETANDANVKGYWLGNETDVNLTYNYTEDVTFGLSLGWFVPGDVFSPNQHVTAQQAIANVGVKF